VLGKIGIVTVYYTTKTYSEGNIGVNFFVVGINLLIAIQWG